MFSVIGPGLGASCAAWARVGEGWSSQRREAAAVAYIAATRTCSVRPFHHQVVFRFQVSGESGLRL